MHIELFLSITRLSASFHFFMCEWVVKCLNGVVRAWLKSSALYLKRSMQRESVTTCRGPVKPSVMYRQELVWPSSFSIFRWTWTDVKISREHERLNEGSCDSLCYVLISSSGLTVIARVKVFVHLNSYCSGFYYNWSCYNGKWKKEAGWKVDAQLLRI